MNILFVKTYCFFFLMIPIILALSFFNPKNTFDVNIGDTYYVIKNSHLGIILSTLYLVVGTIYFFLYQNEIFLNKWIVASHTLISVFGIILIWLLLKTIHNPIANIGDILKWIKINTYLTYICFVIFGTMIFIQLIFGMAIILKIAK